MVGNITYRFCAILIFASINVVQPTCVLESDFGFKINCAFKKSGLFRVRNLGGIKAHASLGFSLGDELGFEQSLTNLDQSRRRSVSVKNGVPPNLIADTSATPAVKQEKRGKQNRIMMRPMAPASRPNQAAMDKLTSLHRRGSSTMKPIVVSNPTAETPNTFNRANPTLTMAKPMPMGVPPFKPLPPKEDTLKVLPIVSTTRKAYTPLQVPQSKGPGLLYQSENYPHVSHEHVSKMVSQMTSSHVAQPLLRITPTPIIVDTPKIYTIPTTVNPFVPMPIAAPPTQALTIIPAPILNHSIQPSLVPAKPTYLTHNTISTQSHKTNPISNFVDPVPHQVHDLANMYPAYNTKKVDDYNSITGYGDDTALKFNKEDINAKIAEIAKAGNISMEAVEAAIVLRQQQLLSKYANLPIPTTTTSTSTTTTTTEEPLVFQSEPEPDILVPSIPQKPKRQPTTGKVMNAPREYYPVGYEKNFDDHFQSKVDLPETNFHCGDQKYFPGLYGDESLGCMVFHVCALTDEGLVMKSFLCPESTLFDQTILKCNWWFYVDCKNTRRLYDTNIPVSKSYQLMKALTFFSSYKKEMQSNEQQNPEDVAGIKEAISILENQDSKPIQAGNEANGVQIITPQTFVVDERNNHKNTNYNETFASPVYRANRNFNETRKRASTKRNPSQIHNSAELKSTSVNSDVKNEKDNPIYPDEHGRRQISSTESNLPGTSAENNTERKHRRRMTLKHKNSSATSTTLAPSSSFRSIELTTSSTEVVNQENFVSSPTTIRQETLTDQLESVDNIDSTILRDGENSPPIKRFYRSSAEVEKEDKKEEKEMALVNNEKVQIIRPTSMLKLVGEHATPTATIAKLDEAVLGKVNYRVKKEAVTIVTPQRYDDVRRSTTRFRT